MLAARLRRLRRSRTRRADARPLEELPEAIEADHPYLRRLARRQERRTTAVAEAARSFRNSSSPSTPRRKRIDDHNHIKLGLESQPRRSERGQPASLPRDKFVLWRDLFGETGRPVLTATERSTGICRASGRAPRSAARRSWPTLKKALPPQYPFLQVIRGQRRSRKEQHVWLRGNPTARAKRRRRVSSRSCRLASRKPFTKGSGRLELAEAIADPQNPLTARVIVNRIWQHHFGQGIVRTPSNFGQLGDRPAHPELLDYLAARFVENKWSIKAMHREIMLSAAYAAERRILRPKNYAADPENRLLWRAQPPPSGCRGDARFDAVRLRQAGSTAGGPPAQA